MNEQRSTVEHELNRPQLTDGENIFYTVTQTKVTVTLAAPHILFLECLPRMNVDVDHLKSTGFPPKPYNFWACHIPSSLCHRSS